jgi:hypothetical protein
MANVKKKTHSFESALYDELAETASALGITESAALGEGALLWIRKQKGLRAVAEWEAEHGAFTQEEIAAVDRELDQAGIGA